MDLNSPSDGWTPMPPMLVAFFIFSILNVFSFNLNNHIPYFDYSHNPKIGNVHYLQEARMWQQCTTTVIDGNIGWIVIIMIAIVINTITVITITITVTMLRHLGGRRLLQRRLQYVAASC